MTQHHPRGRHERRSRPPSLGPHTLILPTPSSINIMHSKARGYFRQQRCVPSLHSTPWSLWVAPRTSHFWRCYPSQPEASRWHEVARRGLWERGSPGSWLGNGTLRKVGVFPDQPASWSLTCEGWLWSDMTWLPITSHGRGSATGELLPAPTRNG